MRMKPEVRREYILGVALDLAEVKHYLKITRFQLAEQCDISEGLVTHYFGTMTKLRRDIIRHAIKERRLPIIAQGLTSNDPHARKAPPELQREALNNV